MQEKEGNVAHFLKYNNTVPIVLGILFLSTSATLAANPAVRDTVYKAETQVQSVDNSYIVSVDLEDYPFAIRVTKVTEDDTTLYLAYDFDTIDIVDGVWQDVTRRAELKISKAQLGTNELEVFAENEFAQLKWHEANRLMETQEYEKRLGVSQKVVATAYRGIVGKFFEGTEERVPQYDSQVAKNDPLRVKNAQPLVTWDENAEPVMVEGDDDEDYVPTDKCPDMLGIQLNPNDCNENNGGGGGGSEEPPVEEPPVGEPPSEEPPAEEPLAEGGDGGESSGGESSGGEGGDAGSGGGDTGGGV